MRTPSFPLIVGLLSFTITVLTLTFVPCSCDLLCSLAEAAEKTATAEKTTANSSNATPAATIRIWPKCAPGETNSDIKPEKSDRIDCPMINVFVPKPETSNGKCMILFPGGGYRFLSCYPNAFYEVARYLTDRGFVCVVLQYRVPARKNVEHFRAAWQDAQRTIRLVRSHSSDWNFNPEKIGVLGGSAGAHLVLMAALNSQTPAYEPVDELDKIPCHVNFAIPLYPAYVLEEEKDGRTSVKTNSLTLADTFHFDAKTPPFCIMHGDADATTAPTGSIALYRQLRVLGIPAELHVYAKAKHTFVVKIHGPQVGTWLETAYQWTQTLE